MKGIKNVYENNLANGFIKSSKFLARAFIPFNKKLNKNLQKCINYQGLNNLTIKNCYPLFLVGKLLDPLG